MGLQNIIDGNGIGLAVTGMLIVFFGLVFISLYITALPRVFAWTQAQQRRAKRKAPTPARTASGLDDPALCAAIALVIQMELDNEQVLDAQRITIARDEAQGAWAFAGKMRTLSTRM